MSEVLNSFAHQFGAEDFSQLAIGVGWLLLEVAFIITLGWLVLRYLVSRLVRWMERTQFLDATVRGVAALSLRWLIILLTGYYVMLAVGVQTTAIIGVITGSALAIGLAMQGTLSNVASGIMLLVLRPLSVGDYITCNGHSGTVVGLGIFYTDLETIEKYRVSIPNGSVFGNAIINMTKNPILTGRLYIDVSYDADLDQVKSLLIASTKTVKGILTQPEPAVLIQNLGASAVNLEVRFDANRENIWPTLRDAREAAKKILNANGIEIPFPQTTVHYKPQGTG